MDKSVDNEKKMIETMRQDPALRKDLFTLKTVIQATGLSRTMLINLEKKGFLTPEQVDERTGWRYYDTFQVFKILQYKRLRLIGLTQNEVFRFYQSGNEGLAGTLQDLLTRQKLLERDIEILKLRLDKEQQYSFSFYDFPDLTCLTIQGEVSTLSDSNTLGYNLSVEAVARGLRPLETEELFCENEDRYSLQGEERPAPWHIKIYQPVDPASVDGESDPKIERVRGCHTFSILVYGLWDLKEMRDPWALLREEVKRRGLTPTGEPVRVQVIVANYTAMHLGPSEHVLRIAVPVR